MAEADAIALVEQGLFKDAAALIYALPNPTKAQKVLRLQIDSYLQGDPLHSQQSAAALLRDHLNAAEQAVCYEVIGRTSVGAGQTEIALKAMRSAVRAASRANAPVLAARIIASHAAVLLHWGALEPAAEEVTKLRRACVVAGDPQALISFHRLVAEIKAKMGLPAAARQSVAAARSLLANWPNVAQQGLLAVTTSAIEFMQSDIEAALRYTTEALECARRSGSREIHAPAIGNLAHIKLAQGKLDEARRAVEDFVGVVRKGGTTEIAGLDTEMEIALAEGDLELARSLGRRVAEISNNLHEGNSYHGLWNLITQVRLCYRLGQPEAGLKIALDAIPRIKRIADRNLLARMELLAAEGFGRTGQASTAADMVARTVMTDPAPPLEIIGEVSRVWGRLAAHDHPGAAIAHFRRAFRVFAFTGHSTAQASVYRDAREIAPELSLQDMEHQVVADDRPSSASLSEQISALLELNEYPPLLAKEVATLLDSTGATVTTKVVETKPDSLLPKEPNYVWIPVGLYRERQYHVIALPKPSAAARGTVLSIERLITSALAIAQGRQERKEQTAFWPADTPHQELGLVVASDRMRELVKLVRRAGNAPLSVLLTGESGVGKELFARALHIASPRKDKTFLPFNCATVPKDMLDSQLFGHRRGAFTGAHETGIGVIRAADGGTLFLDEIGEMSMEAQPKLLRFLESGEIHPLGEPRPVHVDVRIVAATNANLDQLVSDGKFREDLFYRLNVLPIHVPPLRERREEVPALVEHFVDKYGREMQKPMMRVADETLEYLLLYRWPGNVRQLANEIRRMVALAEPGALLTPAHLSKEITSTRRTVAVEPSELVMRLDQPLADATDQLERAAIERALTASNGNNDQAAKILGLSRKGLYLKRQRLGLK